MKTIHAFVMALVAALLFCGCNPNAPKYESILDEVLSCMVPDRDNDDVRLVDEDVKTLKATLLYHCCFEKAPKVKNLGLYLYPIEDNFMFQSSDGVEAMKLEKDIYGPAVDSLCKYVEEDGTYPASVILKAIYHLQDQFARAMEIDPQIGIGAAIWLNRFTQQAVKYCPDIRLLTDNYDGIGADYVGIIEMPEGEVTPLTNIILTDFGGERQISFGVNLFVNRVEAAKHDGNLFILSRDGSPEESGTVVIAPGDGGNPKILDKEEYSDLIHTND